VEWGQLFVGLTFKKEKSGVMSLVAFRSCETFTAYEMLIHSVCSVRGPLGVEYMTITLKQVKLSLCFN
jgi:hypothetical protein